ncbi:hypothetical protein KCU81_g1520, partial [Aureobasidium melanogenum]|uniref:Uncharacterized protein n=1 Tax=Aureobasidium melanogenum (strain CBS 110374) TaxID=1043003 RepID=A0A074WV39_AURM1
MTQSLRQMIEDAQSQIEDTQSEVRDMRAENARLRADNANLRADNANLRAQNNGMGDFLANDLMPKVIELNNASRLHRKKVSYIENQMTQLPQQIRQELLDKAVPVLEQSVKRSFAQNRRAIMAADDDQDSSHQIMEITEEEWAQSLESDSIPETEATDAPRRRVKINGPRGPRPQTPDEEPARDTTEEAVPGPRMPRSAAVSNQRITRSAAKGRGVAVPSLVNLEPDPFKAAQKRKGKSYRPRRTF